MLRKRKHDTDACTVESKFFERTAAFKNRPDVSALLARRQELQRCGKHKQAQKLDEEIRTARALQEDEVDFLLRMGPIIKQFEDELQPSAEPPPQPAAAVSMPRQQDVLAFFKPQKAAKSQKLAPNQDIGSFVSVTKQGRRRQMYYTYLAEFESDSPELAEFAVVGSDRDNAYQCPCGATMVEETVTASLVCEQCGRTRSFQHNDVSGLSYDQQMSRDITTHFAYDRANHFKEWVNQFQAQENCQVDPEVLEKLKAEFKKEGIRNTSGITQLKVRQYLKKLQLHKWYCLYKFCELLGEDEYLPYFPLLKSPHKLYEQDQIWKRICSELRWEFIKTV